MTGNLGLGSVSPPHRPTSLPPPPPHTGSPVHAWRSEAWRERCLRQPPLTARGATERRASETHPVPDASHTCLPRGGGQGNQGSPKAKFPLGVCANVLGRHFPTGISLRSWWGASRLSIRPRQQGRPGCRRQGLSTRRELGKPPATKWLPPVTPTLTHWARKGDLSDTG